MTLPGDDEFKKMLLQAGKDADAETSPLKELTKEIVGLERQAVYGSGKSPARLGKIRELFEAARKKGEIC